MTTVRYTRDPKRPYRLSDEVRARLDAMPDEAVTTAAQDDPDNPPLAGAERERLRAARLAKAVRAKSGLSQAAFAETFRISIGRLRDLEQGRGTPDKVLVGFLALIESNPAKAAEVVRRLDLASA